MSFFHCTTFAFDFSVQTWFLHAWVTAFSSAFDKCDATNTTTTQKRVVEGNGSGH
jgi:hypothetical protein